MKNTVIINKKGEYFSGFGDMVFTRNGGRFCPCLFSSNYTEAFRFANPRIALKIAQKTWLRENKVKLKYKYVDMNLLQDGAGI